MSSMMMMNVTVDISQILLLLFLPLTRFMILEPIEHVFAFNGAISFEPTGYLLYLFSTWGSCPLLVQAFKHAYLFLRRVPP